VRRYPESHGVRERAIEYDNPAAERDGEFRLRRD
jgi:hypothetical protein